MCVEGRPTKRVLSNPSPSLRVRSITRKTARKRTSTSEDDQKKGRFGVRFFVFEEKDGGIDVSKCMACHPSFGLDIFDILSQVDWWTSHKTDITMKVGFSLITYSMEQMEYQVG